MSIAKKNALILCIIAAFGVHGDGMCYKEYVKQQTDPASGRVHELTEVSKRNKNVIKDVDSRAQSGIQSVQAKATEIDGKAVAADKKALEAQDGSRRGVQDFRR